MKELIEIIAALEELNSFMEGKKKDEWKIKIDKLKKYIENNEM